jgi:two-component system CheB/CheR fusion protein
MSQLIKEVLEYSKVTNSKKDFQQSDLDKILKTVLEDLDLLIAETNAQIVTENELPAIEAIPLQLNQLFYNILVNAIKFSKPSEAPVIRISSRIMAREETKTFLGLNPDVSYIEIQIRDNGIGFDQQFGEQIFQLFERLHGDEAYTGTGVGLALCKKIVENHHGNIYALSKKLKELRFIYNFL